MNTILLTWNAKKWPKSYLDQMISEYERGQHIHRWSCGGSTKFIAEGDRAFLMRQGADRGLFGSGHVVRAPYQDSHFEPGKDAAGKSANFVMVEFDYLTDPFTKIVIPDHELRSPSLNCTAWNAQGSGKRIPELIAQRIEEIWAERTGVDAIVYADELPDSSSLFEGAIKRVTVNRYERDPKVRQRCLGRYGYACSACEFRFEDVYGPIGKAYIHVHHLIPVSKLGANYEVNPEKDLRPVCPNCHAMLHSEDPPMSIEKLQTLLRLYAS